MLGKGYTFITNNVEKTHNQSSPKNHTDDFAKINSWDDAITYAAKLIDEGKFAEFEQKKDNLLYIASMKLMYAEHDKHQEAKQKQLNEDTDYKLGADMLLNPQDYSYEIGSDEYYEAVDRLVENTLMNDELEFDPRTDFECDKKYFAKNFNNSLQKSVKTDEGKKYMQKILRNEKSREYGTDLLSQKMTEMKKSLAEHKLKIGKTADVKTGKVTDKHQATAKTQTEIAKDMMQFVRRNVKSF